MYSRYVYVCVLIVAKQLQSTSTTGLEETLEM